MHKYVLLQDPRHNRVFLNKSEKISLAELQIACNKFEGGCENLSTVSIGGINYFSFEMEKEITTVELSILSRLTFVFAIFEVIKLKDHDVFLPVTKEAYEYIDPKISSILKYSGKTNEIFTRLMINVGLLSTNFSSEETINLLDPMAGKGTTLFEGLIQGFNVTGIEIESKPVKELESFFKKFLEKEKFKHITKNGRIHVKETTAAAVTQTFSFAPNKDLFKEEADRKSLSIIHGNSIYAGQYFKKDLFHLIVGDLPCGSGHSKTAWKRNSAATETPGEFLSQSLPGWHKVLKKNGALVVSWNKFLLPKNEILNLLKANGFEIIDSSEYNEFEHKVDLSIKRDFIVAKK